MEKYIEIGLILITIIIGFPVLKEALENIRRKEFFDENMLVSLAIFGAICLGDVEEALSVTILYRLGEYIEHRAVEKADAAMKMSLQRDRDRRKGTDNWKSISPLKKEREEVEDPCHCHVHGSGESFGGGGQTEKFITRFARIYTPVVCGLAVMTVVAPPLLGMGSFSMWLKRALSFLIISCPCSLVISIPLAFAGGITALSKKGIHIGDSNIIESLGKGLEVSTFSGFLTEEEEGVAMKASKKVMRIVYENISLSLGTKIIVLICSALGYSPMWLAVFADVGICLIAILNSVRTSRV